MRTGARGGKPAMSLHTRSTPCGTQPTLLCRCRTTDKSLQRLNYSKFSIKERLHRQDQGKNYSRQSEARTKQYHRPRHCTTRGPGTKAHRKKTTMRATNANRSTAVVDQTILLLLSHVSTARWIKISVEPILSDKQRTHRSRPWLVMFNSNYWSYFHIHF
jgi:hypothetical protein